MLQALKKVINDNPRDVDWGSLLEDNDDVVFSFTLDKGYYTITLYVPTFLYPEEIPLIAAEMISDNGGDKVKEELEKAASLIIPVLRKIL